MFQKLGPRRFFLVIGIAAAIVATAIVSTAAAVYPTNSVTFNKRFGEWTSIKLVTGSLAWHPTYL